MGGLLGLSCVWLGPGFREEQEEVAAGAVEAGFVHQHVEGEGGEVVGKGVDGRVGFHRDDLEAGLAVGAGFGLDAGVGRAGGAFEALVGDAAGVLAGYALDAGDVPFAGAQAAGGVAHAMAGVADAHDAGHRRCATGGALAALEAGRDVAGGEAEGGGSPQHLQAGADERGEGQLDGVGEVFVAAQDGTGEGGETLFGEIGEGRDGVLEAGRGVGHDGGGEVVEHVRPVGRERCAVGVEGRHAVLAAAVELGFARRGGGAAVVEQGLLGVGEAGGEGEEVGHRVARGELAQARGAVGEDPGRGQAVGAGVAAGLGGDFFGAEEFRHAAAFGGDEVWRGADQPAPRTVRLTCRSSACTRPGGAAWPRRG